MTFARFTGITIALSVTALLAGCNTPTTASASAAPDENSIYEVVEAGDPEVTFVTPTPEPIDATTQTPTDEPTPTTTEAPKPEALVNVGSNLRAGPGTGFKVITGLVFGTIVQLEGRNEDSDWVYITASEERAGWIFAPLVGFSAAQIAEAPVRSVDETATVLEPTSVAEAATPTAVPTEDATKETQPTMDELPADVATEAPTPSEAPRSILASGNLLVNGGFEEPYYRIATAEGGGAVANGWTAWWFNDVGDTYQVPEYEIAPLFRDPFRVRSGGAAQQMFRPSTRWLAGVYQQVAVTDNARLRLTIYGHAWSTFCIPVDGDEPICDARDSNREGRGAPLFMRVGIDPTGGTNAFSETIVWSPEQVIWDTYAPFTVEATTTGGMVTIFTYGAPEFGAPINNAYWDDAELIILQ